MKTECSLQRPQQPINWPYAVQIFPPYFSEINFNITSPSTPRSAKWHQNSISSSDRFFTPVTFRPHFLALYYTACRLVTPAAIATRHLTLTSLSQLRRFVSGAAFVHFAASLSSYTKYRSAVTSQQPAVRLVQIFIQTLASLFCKILCTLFVSCQCVLFSYEQEFQICLFM